MKLVVSLCGSTILTLVAYYKPVAGVPGISLATPLMNMVTYGKKAEIKDPKAGGTGGIIIAELDPNVKPPAQVTDPKLIEANKESKELVDAQKDQKQGWIKSIWTTTTDTTVYIAGTATGGVMAVVNVAVQADKLLTDVFTGFPDLIVQMLKEIGRTVKNGLAQAVQDTLFPPQSGMGYLRKALSLAYNFIAYFSWLTFSEVKNIKVAVVLPQVQTHAPFGVGFLVTAFEATIEGVFDPPAKLADGRFGYTFKSAGINVVGAFDVKANKFTFSTCEGAIYSGLEFNQGKGNCRTNHY